MGRPLNKSFFGPEVGKIKVSFHNGTAVVPGYIVRQVGSTRYEVTADGTAKFIVDLAQTSALANALTAGYMTITATDGTTPVFIKNLMAYSALTTENARVLIQAGAYVVDAVVPAPVPTSGLTIDAIAEQTAGVAFQVTGTYTGTAPATLQVKVGSANYAATVSPVIGSGVFSFSLTIASAATGVVVKVRDYTGSTAGVDATAAAFDVIAAV